MRAIYKAYPNRSTLSLHRCHHRLYIWLPDAPVQYQHVIAYLWPTHDTPRTTRRRAVLLVGSESLQVYVYPW